MNTVTKLCAAALTALSFAMPASAITYQVDLDAGTANATGFFETDGTLGALTLANFTSFSLNLTGTNFSPLSITSAPNRRLDAGLVTATATDLFFNFDASGTRAMFLLQAGRNDGYGVFCLQATSTAGCSGAGNKTISLGSPTTARYNKSSATGNISFASVASSASATSMSAVPVPAALPLMLGGFGALAVMRRNRRKTDRAA